MRDSKHCWREVATAVILLLMPFPAGAGDRVAQLSAVAGGVEITRAEDGRVEKAVQMGPRVRGGSVFAGDIVATGVGASATLVFSDGTRVELREDTRLAVKEVDLSQQLAEGLSDKPIGRTIKLLAGDIYSEIVENPQIATEFETPSGVAAVKGTRIALSVSPGVS